MALQAHLSVFDYSSGYLYDICTFWVLQGALRELVEKAFLLNLLKATMRGYWKRFRLKISTTYAISTSIGLKNFFFATPECIKLFLLSFQGPKGVGGGSSSESCQWVYERLFKKDSYLKDLQNSHNQCLKMAKKLIRRTFLYFWGLPMGSGDLVVRALLLNLLRGSMRGY